MSNIPPHDEERDPVPGALFILLFIVLLFGKAIDMPIPWLVVFFPIWGTILFFTIRDSFTK